MAGVVILFLKKPPTTAMFLRGFVVGFQRCLTTAAPAQRKRVMMWRQERNLEVALLRKSVVVEQHSQAC